MITKREDYQDSESTAEATSGWSNLVTSKLDSDTFDMNIQGEASSYANLNDDISFGESIISIRQPTLIDAQNLLHILLDRYGNSAIKVSFESVHDPEMSTEGSPSTEVIMTLTMNEQNLAQVKTFLHDRKVSFKVVNEGLKQKKGEESNGFDNILDEGDGEDSLEE